MIPTMRIELINTGSELLIGQTQNTHHSWMAQQLGQHGYRLDHQSTIHDAGPAIREALETALSRSDLVMTTGGRIHARMGGLRADQISANNGLR